MKIFQLVVISFLLMLSSVSAGETTCNIKFRILHVPLSSVPAVKVITDDVMVKLKTSPERRERLFLSRRMSLGTAISETTKIDGAELKLDLSVDESDGGNAKLSFKISIEYADEKPPFTISSSNLIVAKGGEALLNYRVVGANSVMCLMEVAE